jgi:hypothetical protein
MWIVIDVSIGPQQIGIIDFAKVVTTLKKL